MSAAIVQNPVRLSTGVFTDAELDYFDSLGEDYFPSEESNPVGEADWHYVSISTAFQLLHHVFPDPSDVYIAANHFIYWDRKQKGQVIAPDLYIVKGVGRRPRSSYRVWEEGGRTPDVVFEFASEETGKQDIGVKKDIYARWLKVPEYFLFDPAGKIYPERIQGFRLNQGLYEPIPVVDGRLTSLQLGLELLADGILLRFYDPVRRALVPTAAEIDDARRQAEAENARLRAQIEALRARGQAQD
jgi:Uma2 family endonuclease